MASSPTEFGFPRRDWELCFTFSREKWSVLVTERPLGNTRKNAPVQGLQMFSIAKERSFRGESSAGTGRGRLSVFGKSWYGLCNFISLFLFEPLNGDESDERDRALKDLIEMVTQRKVHFFILFLKGMQQIANIFSYYFCTSVFFFNLQEKVYFLTFIFFNHIFVFI